MFPSAPSGGARASHRAIPHASGKCPFRDTGTRCGGASDTYQGCGAHGAVDTGVVVVGFVVPVPPGQGGGGGTLVVVVVVDVELEGGRGTLVGPGGGGSALHNDGGYVTVGGKESAGAGPGPLECGSVDGLTLGAVVAAGCRRRARVVGVVGSAEVVASPTEPTPVVVGVGPNDATRPPDVGRCPPSAVGVRPDDVYPSPDATPSTAASAAAQAQTP